MPLEIERKYLVVNEIWREHAVSQRRLRQFYLAQTDKAVVRVRVDDGHHAMLTIKSAAPGLSRQEYEYPLPVADAEAMMPLRRGSILEKTRFHVRHAGRVWEIDVYAGENTGLILAEIEIESEDAVVERPDFIGREVTGEPDFYASRLAVHPYGSWHSDGRQGAGA